MCRLGSLRKRGLNGIVEQPSNRKTVRCLIVGMRPATPQSGLGLPELRLLCDAGAQLTTATDSDVLKG